MLTQQRFIAFVLIALAWPDSLQAAEPRGDRIKITQSQRNEAWNPTKQQASFTVPEGFVVELVASEEQGVVNPIDITFDDAGRLWTTTARMYPMDPDPNQKFGSLLAAARNPDLRNKNKAYQDALKYYQGEQVGHDVLLVFDDLTTLPAQSRIWADGLAIPQSVLPYKDGAFVAHGSEMAFLRDSDGDGMADERQSILTGFGVSDTHTMAHLLIRAPGGWIRYSHGATNGGQVKSIATGETMRVINCMSGRFSLDGTQHEEVITGLNNIWGMVLRSNGQWYGQEANDQGHSVVPMENRTAFKGIGTRRMRPYQPFFPPQLKFRVGGTGLSGLAFADDDNGNFPSEWQDVGLLANPITNTINAVRIVRNTDGTVSAQHLPDFLTSTDNWFRPVNLEMGPDGCLYIADFYNQVISHNEVPRNHPNRDKEHGRIWRIRYVGNELPTVIDFTALADDELTAHLTADTTWAQRAAWHQLVDRNAASQAPAVAAIAGDESASLSARVTALWVLDGLDHYDAGLMRALVVHSDDNLRREAVRALSGLPVSADDLATLLKPLADDANPMVRSQVLRTVVDADTISLGLVDLVVSMCRPELGNGQTGGGYERLFERYLAAIALEAHPDTLRNYIDSELAQQQPASHLEWAIAALSAEDRATHLLAKLEHNPDGLLDDTDFILACQTADYPGIAPHITRHLNSADGQRLLELAVLNHRQIPLGTFSGLCELMCRELIASNDITKVRLGCEASAVFDVPLVAKIIEAMHDKNRTSPDHVAAALYYYSVSPRKYKDRYLQILNEDQVSPTGDIAAFAGLAQEAPAEAGKIAETVLKRIPEAQHSTLLYFMINAKQTRGLINNLITKGIISSSSVDLDLFTRLSSKMRKKNRPAHIVTLEKGLNQARTERDAQLSKQIQARHQLIAASTGDAAKGEPLFDSLCLSCHVVGIKGAAFAPALDGAKHRDHTGLLTAMINPDAAIEGNYQAYRVIKRDGTQLDGFLETESSQGLTMRFMGGSSVFIPHYQVVTSGYLPRQSVMVTGLTDGLSDEQFADLWAFLQTIK